MIEISPAILRQILSYDPATGVLRWKKRTVDMFRDGKHTAEHICAAWNSRFSGEEALSTDTGDGYLRGPIFKRNYLSHRVAWAVFYGYWPHDQIDHINGDRSDNRIKNLRVASNMENGKNAKLRDDNSSGSVGVSWSKRAEKWRSYITVDKKQKHLGYFHSLKEAIKVRSDAQSKYGYHPNHGRTS